MHRGNAGWQRRWRSPEAHFRTELNKATGAFSFGIEVSAATLTENQLTDMRSQCISALLGRVIFAPDDDFRRHLGQDALLALIRLQRQVSYFGSWEGVSGLVKHITDDDTNCQILRMLWDERSEE